MRSAPVPTLEVQDAVKRAPALDVVLAPALAATLLLVLAAAPAAAFRGILDAWQARYGAVSPSGDAAGCQLCHANANGGSPWNAYGWDVLVSLDDASCDLNTDGSVSNAEAFFCIELQNSDGDGSGYDNVTEIGLGTQPGWTNGPFNTLFSRSGTLDRCPDLKVILSHAGGFVPYAAYRIAIAASAAGNPLEGIARLKRFHFDVALSSSPTALPSLLAFAEPDRVLYGSDFPYAPAGAVAAFAGLFEGFAIPDAQRASIDRRAAERLFPRLGRTG